MHIFVVLSACEQRGAKHICMKRA